MSVCAPEQRHRSTSSSPTRGLPRSSQRGGSVHPHPFPDSSRRQEPLLVRHWHRGRRRTVTRAVPPKPRRKPLEPGLVNLVAVRLSRVVVLHCVGRVLHTRARARRRSIHFSGRSTRDLRIRPSASVRCVQLAPSCARLPMPVVVVNQAVVVFRGGREPGKGVRARSIWDLVREPVARAGELLLARAEALARVRSVLGVEELEAVPGGYVGAAVVPRVRVHVSRNTKAGRVNLADVRTAGNLVHSFLCPLCWSCGLQHLLCEIFF
mmetsp:Transcript_17439/g.43409  ORF Transcript_17439/g.43409 Transcript_17439/m.43409 type:complete len:265 (-) Transcript_17439:132-926(-)